MKIKINFFKILISLINNGGESEIRTHERVAPLPVFKTGAFNHSATPPKPLYLLHFLIFKRVKKSKKIAKIAKKCHK